MKSLSLFTSEPMKGAGVTVSSSSPAHHSSPVGTMESDLLMYKQKTEQMAMLIRHYQNELESQKVRRDGVETVSRLLTESRQENAVLKKQLAALQMTVKNLQNRMAVNGLVTGAEDADNEVVIPGTSRQTLTNLALENKRLRSLLQQSDHASDSSNDLQKTAEDTESRHSLEQTVEQLEAENLSMKRKLSDLESLFKSSNNDKDRQLLHYQNEIQRLTQQQSGETDKTGHHRAVAGVSALKEHLKALMEQCTSFESHLESMQQAEPQAEKKEPAVQLVPVSRQAVERADSVDGMDIRQLLEEKQQLQARVDEVMQMNQRWSEFSSERDRYTRTLEQQVQDLQDQLKQAMHKSVMPEINHHIENIMEQSQKELQIVSDRRQKAEDEAARLRQEVAMGEAQQRQLQTQVAILSQTVRQHTASLSEAQGIIEHLKAQIQVCTEDFEKERQDRQDALQKVNSLQEHTTRLQKLNNHLQTLLGQTTRPVQEHGYIDVPRIPYHGRLSLGQMALAADSPSSPPSSDPENFRRSPDLQAESGSREPPLQDPGPVSLPTAPTTVELLSPRGMHKPRHSLSDSALSSEGGQRDNFLTCPKCNREFSEEHQGELLAHMDMCRE